MKTRPRRMTGFFVFIMALTTFTCPLYGELLRGGEGRFLLASWYSADSLIKEGTRKIGERQVMANGKVFRDEGYTAASWDYPLGTRCKVSSMETGRSCYVLVTDRTARRFKGKRIDLSKMAFSSIAKLEAGLVKVKVEVVK